MGNIRLRKETKTLFFDFRYKGIRYREQTILNDTAANRRKMRAVMDRIESDIQTGQFDYARYFPNSPTVAKVGVASQESGLVVRPYGNDRQTAPTPLFNAFAQEWFLENAISWKRSYRETLAGTLKKYLVPHFGEMEVGRIAKGDILKFRSSLAKVENGTKEGLSPDRINHIMTPLRMILAEAADRFQFNMPFNGIKPLKVKKSDVNPFTLDEVRLFLANVRPDFKNYYTVRFFTGMRTGEIDGLKWKHVDFERKEILIRETIVNGYDETTKTHESVREIAMSPPVFDALKSQYEVTAQLSEFVFCARNGSTLDHRNVTKRVWHPTLKWLGLKTRTPYQTRHTTATLWLASGESPEWIARQMGHSNTEMLFRIYSRYVPNLTRRDGSAFESLLCAAIKQEPGP